MQPQSSPTLNKANGHLNHISTRIDDINLNNANNRNGNVRPTILKKGGPTVCRPAILDVAAVDAAPQHIHSLNNNDEIAEEVFLTNIQMIR